MRFSTLTALTCGLIFTSINPLFDTVRPAHAAVITVNSNADVVADDGACVLREALNSVTNNVASGAMPGECPAGDPPPTVDTIAFNLAPGSTTISPTTTYNGIGDPVIIDGYTQPGASPNTLNLGNDAVLVVELEGSQIGGSVADGLRFRVGSEGSEVRGLVINRFSRNGIDVQNTTDITIAGNFLGTDPTGTIALGNNRGVEFGDPSADVTASVIGGPAPADRNIISGNSDAGVGILGDDNRVLNNYIGTDPSGTSTIGGQFSGVFVVVGSGNDVGQPGQGNLISGHFVGLAIAATATTAVDNFIGTDVQGFSPLPNTYGVWILRNNTSNATFTEIGTVDGGNVIAFNNEDGIRVFQSGTEQPQNNRFRGNTIHSNGDLGIDLMDDGVTPNDPLDADEGPNSLQNWPEILTVTDDGTDLTIQWTLSSKPSENYLLEFFVNPDCDPSGSGEGTASLGEFPATTDPGGQASGSITLPSIGIDAWFTATATDLTEVETSEFSPCVLTNAQQGTPIAIPTLSDLSLVAFIILLLGASMATLRRRQART